MNNVKVIIIHNTIAPYRHPLFEELSKKVNLMVYYCSIKENLREWDLWPRKYDYKYKVLPRVFIKTPFGELSLNPSILKEVIRNKPNVMIISGYTDPTTWVAFAVAKLLKIPIIHWTEGIKEPQSILGIITKPLRMLFVKKSNAIIVPGKLSKNYVISLGADVEKVFIAPNAIDNDLFIKISQQYLPPKEKLRSKIGLKDKIVILCVAQLIKRKGIEYLLQAYKKLEQEYDNLMLIIIGSGPLENYLKDLCKSLELKNVRFIPAGMKLDELIKFYCLADIFVLPTLEDVWGFVINEAMACRLPVISTRASQAALEMIVNGKNGYIAREKNVDELFLSLKKLVCSSELRREMGGKSLEIAIRKFNISGMAYGFIKAIRYVLNLDGKHW